MNPAGGGRWWVAMGWVCALVIGLAVGWFGARATLVKPEVAQGDPAPTTYTVASGTVGQSLQFAAQATWPTATKVTNTVQGVVTAVPTRAGSQVNEGDILYAVNLSPVVALTGKVPAFRALKVGTKGPDVRQLQQSLSRLGYLRDAADGTFGLHTRTAVLAWQKHLGVKETGVVRPGQVLFLPALPARLKLSPEIAVGQPVTPGAGTVTVLKQRPDFTLLLNQDQANLVPLQSRVVVHGNTSVTWQARMGTPHTNEQGQLAVPLSAPSGGAVCAHRCELVTAVGEKALFPLDVIVVPEASGPVVPLSALRTGPDGARSVVMKDGRQRQVQIRAESGGRAVVDGVEAGDEVRLFAPPS